MDEEKFENEVPCEVCDDSPTRVVYGENRNGDKFLCKEHFEEEES